MVERGSHRHARSQWEFPKALWVPNYGYLKDKVINIIDLSYDINVTATSMASAGLTQGYPETLETGYWPSQDSLPPEMRF